MPSNDATPARGDVEPDIIKQMRLDAHTWKKDLTMAYAQKAAVAYVDRLTGERDALAQQKDAAYEERNRVVAYTARLSLALGYRVMVTRTAIEGWSDDWHGCVYIDTPNGQASWHFHDSHAHLFADLPHGAMEWDGHTTEEKYERLHESRPENALAQRVAALEADAAKLAELRKALRKFSDITLISKNGDTYGFGVVFEPDPVETIISASEEFADALRATPAPEATDG